MHMNKTILPPIEIDAQEYEDFKFLTKREGKSMSQVIREMVSNYNKKRTPNRSELSDFFKKHQIKNDDPNLENITTNYKRYIYGNS